MKTRFAILLTLCAMLFAPGAYAQKTMIGYINFISIDSTQATPFEGIILFRADTVTIEYWKPAKLNKSKILSLPVKNCKDSETSRDYLFKNYDHDKLFVNGHINYNRQKNTFIFKIWNKGSQFVYYGKLL